MKAILPAAGYATRMYPLTFDTPKALLPVNGKPIIEYILEKIVTIKEIDEIFIVTNNIFYKRFEIWHKNLRLENKIIVINDNTNSNEERLGTIGDIVLVLDREKIDEDFLVINADNLFSFDLVEMYRYFNENSSCIALFDVGDLEIARRMGNPVMDSNNRIIFFKEKDQNTKSSLCSVGIYFFERAVIGMMGEYLLSGNSPDRSGDFIEWLYTKVDVYCCVFDNKKNFWFDVGSKDSYEKACEIVNRSL